MSYFSFQASDIDQTNSNNSVVRFELSQFSDFKDNFAIDSTTGVLTVTSEIDYESIHHSHAGLLNLVVEAHDLGSPSLSANVSVTVRVLVRTYFVIMSWQMAVSRFGYWYVRISLSCLDKWQCHGSGTGTYVFRYHVLTNGSVTVRALVRRYSVIMSWGSDLRYFIIIKTIINDQFVRILIHAREMIFKRVTMPTAWNVVSQ